LVIGQAETEERWIFTADLTSVRPYCANAMLCAALSSLK